MTKNLTSFMVKKKKGSALEQDMKGEMLPSREVLLGNVGSEC